MIKFYTPHNWMSVFDAPSIIIDDDGLIYSADEYYKLLKTACGRVDTKTGYIYGKGHYSKLTLPVGMVKRGHNCIEIYGDDFASIMAVPIYYIQGDAVYTAEEYGKFFKSAEGYIKRDTSMGGQGGYQSLDGASAGAGREKATGGCLSVLWTVIKTVVLIIFLLALSGWLWNEMYFSGNEYKDVFVANIICLIVGLVVAIFNKDKKVSSFLVIFWISTILMGLYIAVGMFMEDGFGFKTVLFSVLGMLISALFCLVPSILLSVIKGSVKLIVCEIRNKKKKRIDGKQK